MSWSEGRRREGLTPQDVMAQLDLVNHVLQQIVEDQNFQDDMQTDICQTAVKHWTGKERLAPEVAEEMIENYRVRHVYKRFTEISQVCKDAGIGVPLEHIQTRRTHMDNEVVLKQFGKEVWELYCKEHPESHVSTKQSAQQVNSKQSQEDEETKVDNSIDWKQLIMNSLIETIVYGVIAYIMAQLVIRSGALKQFQRDTEADVDMTDSTVLPTDNQLLDEDL